MDMESYYRKLFQTHGDTPSAVQYSDVVSQEKRYEVLASIADLEGCSVLDYGCGTGHLATFLKSRNIHVYYTGVDLVREMLACGAKKHPEYKFLRPDELGESCFDYVIISGVFNLKAKNCRAFYRRVVKECYSRVRKGIAFNMMSSYVDYYDPQLFYERPEAVFRYVKKEISPYVVLRNDYQVKQNTIPFEFTVYVYKR